jgi:hypothetical protein
MAFKNIREAVAEFLQYDYAEMKDYKYGEKGDYPIELFEVGEIIYTATKIGINPDNYWKEWGDGEPEFNWVNQTDPYVCSQGWQIWAHQPIEETDDN